jgi:replicative DNA helicase
VIHAERALLSHLTDIEALDKIARSGFDAAVMPSQPLRKIVEWALGEYYRTNCLQAPTREFLLDTWKTTLEDAEVELIDEDTEVDSVEGVMEWLNSNYVYASWQSLLKVASAEVAEADIPKRVATVQKWASEFVGLAYQVTDHTGEYTGASGLADALRRYDEDVTRGPGGMTFGLPQLDEHTGGIQPGELAILAAGPKVGKSLYLARSAFLEHLRGRTVALFTLENSSEMTVDRIICMVGNIDYQRWQRRECTPDELARVGLLAERVEELEADGVNFHVINPDRAGMTMEAMVHRAHTLSADSLYIDQLTFVEHPNPGRKANWELMKEKLHDLKGMISTGRKIPCLLAHQINRDGVKASEKSGELDMTMLAESSEVERTADWVFGLYQGPLERQGQTAKLQILAARRAVRKSWLLTWRPAEGGDVTVLHEIQQ